MNCGDRSIIKPITRIAELAKHPSGMYRAYLGEDYDGIGQYVLVTLSRATTAGGYKGRVASGDFGGGRTFPQGTPVLIRSYRGGVEVFLGNKPRGCIITWPDEHTGGWGEVVGVPTHPDFPNWMETQGCQPGDDWYSAPVDSVVFSTSNGVATIDTTITGIVQNDPKIWYTIGDPIQEVGVGDDALELKIGLNVEKPNPASQFLQIDFYINSDDRQAPIGTVGDNYFITFEIDSGQNQVNLRNGFFANIMDYNGLGGGFGAFQEYKAPVGDFSLINTDIWILWRLERNTTDGNVDMYGKVWRDDVDEPEEFQSYWKGIIDGYPSGSNPNFDWRGAQNLIIYPFWSNAKFHLRQIEDITRKLCATGDDREFEDCNGL